MDGGGHLLRGGPGASSAHFSLRMELVETRREPHSKEQDIVVFEVRAVTDPLSVHRQSGQFEGALVLLRNVLLEKFVLTNQSTSTVRFLREELEKRMTTVGLLSKQVLSLLLISFLPLCTRPKYSEDR